MQFIWARSKNGFFHRGGELFPAHTRGKRSEAIPFMKERQGDIERYEPRTGLFRTFASLARFLNNTELCQAKILDFADEYGDLFALPDEGSWDVTFSEFKYEPQHPEKGVCHVKDGHKFDPTKDLPPSVLKFASLDEWYVAIQHMARTVELWDDFKARDYTKLAKRFKISPGIVTYAHSFKRRFLATKWEDLTPDMRAEYDEYNAQPVFDQEKNARERREGEKFTREYFRAHAGDICRRYAPIEVREDRSIKPTKKPLQHAEAALRFEIRAALTGGYGATQTFLDLAEDGRIVPRPENLLAFLWFSLARVVGGELEERPCAMFEKCGRYIYIGEGGGEKRADAATCSATCRKRKQRSGRK